MSTQTLSTLSFNNTTLDIIDRNGQRWLQGNQISRALGYVRSDAITKIYDRNADEFTEKMTQVIQMTKLGVGNKSNELQSNSTRIYSPRGAHLLAMFARTDNAKGFRKWVLDVLDTATARPPLTTEVITPAQKLAIRDTIHARVAAVIPEGKKGTAYRSVYSDLYHHFAISSYSELPAIKFDEAVAMIAQWVPSVQPAIEAKQARQPATQHDMVTVSRETLQNLLDHIKTIQHETLRMNRVHLSLCDVISNMNALADESSMTRARVQTPALDVLFAVSMLEANMKVQCQ